MMLSFFSHLGDRKTERFIYSISIRRCRIKMGSIYLSQKGNLMFSLTFISKKLQNMQTQFNKFDVTTVEGKSERELKLKEIRGGGGGGGR